MENTLEIQKEFEILVSELERLKSINELTSSNANSAKVVVNEIEKFIKSVEQFKLTIDQDLKHKNSKIELILKQLEEAVISMANDTKNSVTEHSNNLKVLHEKSDSVINEHKEILNIELSKFVGALSNLSESISLTIDSSSSKISDKIREQTEQVEKQLKKISELIEMRLSTVENSLNDKFGALQRLIEQNKKLNKRNGVILIVSAILTLGLLIALLLK